MYPALKSVGLFAILLAIYFLYPSSAFGQSTTQLRGRVTDQSGEYIGSAKVTLYSDDRVRTTKADDDGSFVFSGLSSPGRFLEVSASGFTPASIRIGDKSPTQFSVTLQVGQCFQCTPLIDIRDRSVHYEERSGLEQLSGTVGEYVGPFLEHVSLILKKADLDGPRAAASFANPNVSMSERNFDYSLVAQSVSDGKGRFHFSALEPGWYRLAAGFVGYYGEVRYFWIARETLTQPSPLQMVPIGGASPMQPAQQTTPLVRPQ